jgi:hypothetical protein
MEKFSPELIIAISGLITGVLATISAFIVARKKDKKDQITLLREEVERLEKDKEKLCKECDKWRDSYKKLFMEILEIKEKNLSLNAVIEKHKDTQHVIEENELCQS